MEPPTLLEEVLIQLLLNRRELIKKKKKKTSLGRTRLFQTMTALSSLLPSARSTSFCESVKRVCITALIASPWFNVFNSDRWPLSFVRAACSSQAGLLVQSQRVDIKTCAATTDSADGRYFLTGLQRTLY